MIHPCLSNMFTLSDNVSWLFFFSFENPQELIIRIVGSNDMDQSGYTTKSGSVLSRISDVKRFVLFKCRFHSEEIPKADICCPYMTTRISLQQHLSKDGIYLSASQQSALKMEGLEEGKWANEEC